MISHGYDATAPRFREEFDWTGTDDPTAWLAVPECIRWLGGLLPGGWPELMARNHALALQARATLCGRLGVAAPCPDAMVGSMAALPLPAAAPGSAVARLDQDQLAAWCRAHGVEAWFYPWPCAGGKVVRASAQLYNHEGEYERLAELLLEALA